MTRLDLLARLASVGMLLAALAIPDSASRAASAVARPADSTSFDGLFTGDNGADADPQTLQELITTLRGASSPGTCPFGKLVVVTPGGDEMFQNSVANFRRETVLKLLNGAGIDVSRLFVDSLVQGTASSAWLETAGDQEKPRLDTRSDPEKGSIVSADTVITVTMVANDDAEPRHRQTGIKSVQLVADSDGGRFLESQNYEPCSDPAEHRVVVTYQVPDPPPLVVRLTALAEDHAGHQDSDVGEFPTEGDWYGHLEWTFHAEDDVTRGPNENRGETRFTGSADMVLKYDGRGNLEGRLAGTQVLDTIWWGYPHGSGEVCRGESPETPVTARVLGSYTPGTRVLTLQLVDLSATMSPTWSGGGPTLLCSDIPPIDMSYTLQGLVGAPQAINDDTYQQEFQTPSPQRSTYKFALRRVRR